MTVCKGLLFGAKQMRSADQPALRGLILEYVKLERGQTSGGDEDGCGQAPEAFGPGGGLRRWPRFT
jgi:hypothetical protein